MLRVVERRQACSLPAIGRKVLIRQPCFIGFFELRPFAVDDGKPGGVAVAALDDHGLTKQTFVTETKPPDPANGLLVEGIALPFQAPVAQPIKNKMHDEIHRFGGDAGMFETVAEMNVADFN